MMKKFCLMAISLFIAAVFMAAPYVVCAETGAGINDYPEILSEKLLFANITDYAIGNDSAAFADGDKIILWTSNEIATEYSFNSPVSALDYEADKYYYTLTGSEDVFILASSPNEEPVKAAFHDFSEPDYYSLENDLYYYYYNQDGVFNVLNKSTDATTPFSEYDKIKLYENELYAIKENSIFKIKGEKSEKIDYIFSNFDKLTKIYADGALDKLSVFSAEPVLVTLSQGSYMTLFNMNRLDKDSEFYPVTEPRNNTDNNIKGNALLLCETGNTGVVALGTNTYLLNKSNYSKLINLEASAVENATATVNAEDWAYSLPFMSAPTRLFSIAPTDEINVIAEIPADYLNNLAHDFYLVEKRSADGSNMKGYVAKEFLNLEYGKFNEGGTTVLPDPGERHDDYIKTVVLVLVVIVLVLIAAGYITWISASGKKQIKENNDRAEIKSEHEK